MGTSICRPPRAAGGRLYRHGVLVNGYSYRIMWTQGRVDESRVCNNHRAGTAREISDAVILGYKALVPRNVQPQALRD